MMSQTFEFQDRQLFDSLRHQFRKAHNSPFKETVHPPQKKNLKKILVNPKLYDILSSSGHKRRYFDNCICLFFLFFCLFVFFYQQNICFCILQKIESHAGLEGHDLESCEHINKLNKLYKKSLPPYNILCNLYIYTMTCIISMHAL